MAETKYNARGDIADIELIALGARLEAARLHADNLEATASIDGGASAYAARDAIWEVVEHIAELPAYTISGLQVKAQAIAWHDHGAGVHGLQSLLGSLGALRAPSPHPRWSAAAV